MWWLALLLLFGGSTAAFGCLLARAKLLPERMAFRHDFYDWLDSVPETLDCPERERNRR